MTKKLKSYQRGAQAEKWAAFFLRLKGYRILAMRYKTPVGEVDLIARRGRRLVFVEVKARGEIGDALYAVNDRTQVRIQKAAGHFIAHYPEYADYDMRFDVVAFAREFMGGCWPRHLDNAWQARS